MKLSIFYTSRCNFKCRHCFVGNIPIKVMPDDMLSDIIKLSKKNNIDYIAFSGGEPMLYINRIINVINYVTKSDIFFSISTNGYWAKNRYLADEICKVLKEKGFFQIEVSFDQYHADFIPIDNVFNIYESACKYNMQFKVIMSVANDWTFILLLVKLKKIIPQENIILQNVAKFGNAEINQINSCYKNSNFINKKCQQIMNPCITYNGDVYACCGPCITNGKKNILFLGNLYIDEFNLLVQKMLTNEIFIKIKNKGPASLEYINEEKMYSSLCEFCINYSECSNLRN